MRVMLEEMHIQIQPSHIQTRNQQPTYLYICYREYSHSPTVLSFIPVVIYLPDDVHCITLFKCQLPVTQFYEWRASACIFHLLHGHNIAAEQDTATSAARASVTECQPGKQNNINNKSKIIRDSNAESSFIHAYI